MFPTCPHGCRLQPVPATAVLLNVQHAVLLGPLALAASGALPNLPSIAGASAPLLHVLALCMLLAAVGWHTHTCCGTFIKQCMAFTVKTDGWLCLCAYLSPEWAP